MSGTLFLRYSRPMNRSENPTITSPVDLRRSFLENINSNDKPISGMAMLAIENLKPMRETSQAVIVVPILAPIMTEIDSARVSSPAFTKLTTITVVADEDWMIEVTMTPVSTPSRRFLVIDAKIERILLPATFCRASLIMDIPKRKSPRAPRSCNTSIIPKFIILFG